MKKPQVGARYKCVETNEYYTDRALTVGKIYTIKRYDYEDDIEILTEEGVRHFAWSNTDLHRHCHISHFFVKADEIFLGGE